MSESHPPVGETPPVRTLPRLLRGSLWGLLAIPPLFLLACVWLTDPLDAPASATPLVPLPVVEEPNLTPPPPPSPALEWPEDRLEGLPAKEFLLDWTLAAADRLEQVEGYTATFRKQERVDGTLLDEQVMEMKVRNRPFSIYLKFRNFEPGKEVVYYEGRHDGHVIAHGGGISRLLIPRLKVPPTHTLALTGNRHPITDAGLVNLTNRLIFFRKQDLTDPGSVTILDRVTDDQGRPRYRSTHSHSDRSTAHLPFAHVEVLYDPELRVPVQITSRDWPETGDPTAPPPLAERYTYDDLKLDVPLSDLDFDPANPAYTFRRF